MDSRTPDVPSGHATDMHGPGLRILVAEDHEDTAASLAMLLRLYGYSVEIAADGPTALRAARVSQPDVVLLNIALPKTNGWEVAKQIRQQNLGKRPFLIAITGYGSQADRLRSREAGIDLHLVKPVNNDFLENILRTLQTLICSAPNARHPVREHPDR